MAGKLTARQVATAKPGRHGDGAGLWLVVSDSGAKKWVFRFTFGGKVTDRPTGRQAGTHRPVSACFSDAGGCAQMRKNGRKTKGDDLAELSTSTNEPELETSILESLDSLGFPASNFVTSCSLTGKQIVEELLKRREGMLSLFYDIGGNALLEYNHLNETEMMEIHSAFRHLNWATRPAIFQEEGHKVDLAVFLDAIRDAFVIGAIAGDATIVKRIDAISRTSERDAVSQIHKSTGGRGGIKSGEVRRAKAEETWIPHATELAISIRNEPEMLSQDDTALEIAARWKKADVNAPGQKSLKGLISRLEKDGIIPKMKRVGKRRGFK
jgi:hypothetical protein